MICDIDGPHACSGWVSAKLAGGVEVAAGKGGREAALAPRAGGECMHPIVQQIWQVQCLLLWGPVRALYRALHLGLRRVLAQAYSQPLEVGLPGDKMK